jgi:hypothetical protein
LGRVYAIDPMAAEALSTALAWVDWDSVAAIYLSEIPDAEGVPEDTGAAR